jgi:hypothetical protein
MRRRFGCGSRHVDAHVPASLCGKEKRKVGETYERRRGRKGEKGQTVSSRSVLLHPRQLDLITARHSRRVEDDVAHALGVVHSVRKVEHL